jgi:hypothetical protein
MLKIVASLQLQVCALYFEVDRSHFRAFMFMYVPSTYCMLVSSVLASVKSKLNMPSSPVMERTAVCVT